eukprot:UN05044
MMSCLGFYYYIKKAKSYMIVVGCKHIFSTPKKDTRETKDAGRKSRGESLDEGDDRKKRHNKGTRREKKIRVRVGDPTSPIIFCVCNDRGMF